MKLISVIAPMYNENALVKEYCQETLAVLATLEDRYAYEIILVNDGSADNTLELMLAEQKADPWHIAVVSLTRNFGLEGAVQAGLDYAKGDAVVVMDADLQDPPAVILELVKKWEEGLDVVHAVRASRESDSFFKRASAGFYYKVMADFAGKIKLKQGTANFKLISRKALDILQGLPEKNRVFRVTVPFVGLRTGCVEYARDKRYAGKTKYNLKSMIPYALDSITSVSVEPLRKIRLGIYISALVFICTLAGVLLSSGLWRMTAIVSAVIAFFATIIFVCLSIMAEYIAQIFIEAKGRPISLVESYSPTNRED